MMPAIRISDATFSDLTLMASWFKTKTPSETIDKVVREMMEHLGLERDEQEDAAVDQNDGVMRFERAPGLSFTRVISASINGAPVAKPNWVNALTHTVLQLKKKGFEGEKLVRELQVPARNSKYEEYGYSFHEELGISIQGQSATDAWKEISRLAIKWKIPVTVKFQWRENPKAQHPGKVGELAA